MRKIELLEAVNKRLPVKIHLNMVAIYVGRAFNQIIHETFGRNPSGAELFTKVYLNVEIKKDEDTDTYYSDLPVTIIKMPHVGDGVRAIHSMKGKTVEFVPQRSEMQSIHNDLEVMNMNGPIPFYVLNERVEYVNMPRLNQAGPVKMHLIPEFEALDLLDNIYVPAGMDERLMELAVSFASGIKPTKEINDQSEKTP
jgi:hypothetical protein